METNAPTRRQGHQWPLVVALLVAHGGLLAAGAYVQSPTLNEPAHLVAGICNWKFGRFDIYTVNPPFARMVAALPVLAVGCETDWQGFTDAPGIRTEFLLGQQFVAANGERSMWLFRLARWACIPFSLLGGFVCYWWAAELFGAKAGLLSLTVWCFSPNLLAHGELITNDAVGASLALLACFTYWLWLKSPNWTHVVISGLALGLAELTKTTLTILYPLWPVIWIVYRWPDRRKMERRDWLRELAMIVVRLIIGVYVINLGYGFEEFGKPLGEFRFVSATLSGKEVPAKTPSEAGNRFTDTFLGALPVPLPENYVRGIDLQKRDFEQYDQPSYLGGEYSESGWWYYYLYALAIKVPLGTWLLVVLAATLRSAASPAKYRDEFCLLAPAIVIFSFVSSQSTFSQHMRYVLPVLPFVFVWLGRAALHAKRHGKLANGVLGFTLGWSIASSLFVFPHSLSYFNESIGGPIHGSEHLIHSNVDWGQDLLFLKRWLDRHPQTAPIKLVYFGYVDPKSLGIEYELPDFDASAADAEPSIPPGWYAISANFVSGFPYYAYAGDGTKVFRAQDAFRPFRDLEPTAFAGYSIVIFHVPD